MQRRTAPRSKLLRDLGRRVAELRAERGLTQQECADRLGVTLRYFQSIEGGRENLTVETLERVARALRAGVIDLFIPPVSRTVRRGRPPKRHAKTE